MPREARTHTFVDDPELLDNRTGEQWCRCGLPKSHRVHVPPERDPHEVAVEERWVGEATRR